jgi:CheY-like chemotaxis protein
MSPARSLADFGGRHVLVVEDEYLIADEVCHELRQAGARVLGPVPNVRDALDLIAATPGIDAALLDVNLGGETVYPVADALRLLGVPFVLCTGYDAWALPAAYRNAPRVEKPVDLGAVGAALFEAAGC